MRDKRDRERGFTLIEIVTVIALLAVITATTSVALGKMFGLWRGARTAALIDQRTREALLDLSRELRSATTVRCSAGSGGVSGSDILTYELGERTDEPEASGRWCTVRLVTDGDQPAGLVKEIRADLRGSAEPIAREVLIPSAVELRVRCIASTGQMERAVPRNDVVSLTVWVEGTERGRGPRAYATAVNIPRLLWQGGA
jgi:prepilin-type N-terminal cleavage/methylation domain-containing protein